MRRRAFLAFLAAWAVLPRALAAALDGVSSSEAAQALREGLAQSAKTALDKLGKENGYFSNPRVKIGLPRNFRKAVRILRALGQGEEVDALVLAMNRAAEMAAPKAEPMVQAAVKSLAVPDAKSVLAGGDNAATEYFRRVTEARLPAELLPHVRAVVAPSGLASAYHGLSTTLIRLAGIRSELETVVEYVNKQALDGIYAMIGAEERALRAHPAQYSDGLVAKVFGSLR